MTYSSEVLADSPIAYYRLGESSGTTAVDSSGNGRDGTYVNTPTLGTTGLLVGDSDTAITLASASSESVTCWSDDGALDGSLTTFTAEAWINPTTVSGTPMIINRDGSTNRQFQFRLNAGKVEFIRINGAGNSGTVTAASATTLSTGVTYHVAVVYNGTDIRIYIDGSLDGTPPAATGVLVPVTRDVEIGARTGALFFNGIIDEVALYDTALSSTRIAAHYTAGTTAPGQTGTFDVDLPVSVASFSGSYVPPDETGTFDVDVPLSVPAFTGSYAAPPTGSFAATLTVPVVDFTGSYTAPLDPAGTFAVDLPVPVVDFTGGYTPPPISGSFAADLPLPTVEFSGLVGAIFGSFAVSLPLPTVVFEGSYGGPYPTDTSNLFDGLNMVCIGTVTMTRAAVTPPTAPPKYDKALPYPEPVMVNGRPT